MVSHQHQHQISDDDDETASLIHPNQVLHEDGTAAVFELRWFIRNSLSIVGYYALTLTSRTVGVVACGHLGSTELAASALALMFASMTAFSITYGAMSALDTLSSQAWTGARDKTLIGIHLQRTFLILGVMYMVTAVLWLNATRLFLTIGQDPDVAHYAGLYLRYYLLGAPAYSYFEAIRKYTQAQGVMGASVTVQCVVAPFSILITYVLTFWMQLGFVGVPLAQSITYWMMLLGIILYAKMVRGSEGWGGWDLKASLQDWPLFFRYAVPGMINAASELWCYDLLSLGASYIDVGEKALLLAVQSILMSVDDMTSSVGWGISTAAAIRVGNRLGENKIPWMAIATAYIWATIAGSITTIILWSLRYQIAQWFAPASNGDQEMVRKVVVSLIPLFAVYLVAKTIGNTCTGILRGIGRPAVTAWINMGSYYGIGCPAAYAMAFTAGWGLSGLWIGLCLAIFSAAGIHTIYIVNIHWPTLVRKTHHRIKHEEERIMSPTS